nr:hypothetical protein BaRGS_003312 [Batillaria attramentaria]
MKTLLHKDSVSKTRPVHKNGGPLHSNLEQLSISHGMENTGKMSSNETRTDKVKDIVKGAANQVSVKVDQLDDRNTSAATYLATH